jgi:cell division protein FtsQ
VGDDDFTDRGDDDPEGLDGDADRPLGRVVQLERPRRWGTRAAGGLDDPGTPAAEAVPEDAGDSEGVDDDPDNATPAAGSGPTDSSGADVAARTSGATVTTLRGRSGDGDAVGPTGEPAAGPSDLAAALLHPRLRARRIAIRRMEGLRRLRRLMWVLAGLAVLVDGVALAHTGVVDVDRFVVVGATHTLPAAVREASGIHVGDALLTLDEAAAERRIEQLPWVDHADVVRQWPGTVKITVTERQPAAVLQVSDDPNAPLTLVDGAGRVLEIGAHPDGLIAVTNVPPDLVEGGRVPARARGALRLAGALSQRLPGAVVSTTVDLEATLGSGGVVRFGSTDDLDTKLMALATVLKRVDLECLGTLDLEVADHPALTRDC